MLPAWIFAPVELAAVAWNYHPALTAHSTMYTLHCTLCLYIVLYTLYTVHCILYTVHCTLYIVHCALYTVYGTLYTVYCTQPTYRKGLSFADLKKVLAASDTKYVGQCKRMAKNLKQNKDMKH